MERFETLVQNPLRPGVIELTYGSPDPALLPVEMVRAATGAALDAAGAGMLGYGLVEGPPALRRRIAARIAAREGRTVDPSEILVSGGNSQALEQVLTAFAAPSDVVLVESPTYNLALGILRDHPVEIRSLPLDEDGLDIEALEAVLTRLRRRGRPARLLYTIPTYHNPTGVCLSGPRRRRLLELASEHDLLLVEDDVYRELAYDGDAPTSLWALDPEAPVVRLGSFSKSLAPGLRVGWMNARRDLRERLLAAGVLDSGGCVSQFAAAVVGEALAGDVYDEHIAGLRRAYASRRDALVAELREHLPAGCDFAAPAGGFFVWVGLPTGLSAADLLPLAESRGVAFAPGTSFSGDGDDGSLRLAFSLYDEERLRLGARSLGAALREALGAA